MQWISNQKLREEINQDLWELDEWKRALDDKELVKFGEKLDVYLDEIEFPSNPDRDERRFGYYEIGTFGDEHLQTQPRQVLTKRIRERLPAYRKERREVIETWSKIATSLVAVLGAVTGLVAVVLSAMK